MKVVFKIFIISLIFSIVYILVFTYSINTLQKDYYVLYIGIYEKKENKENKMNELKEKGIEANFYISNKKYYVYSYVSDNKQDVKIYQKENDIKGAIKSYKCFISVDKEQFISKIKEGDV